MVRFPMIIISTYNPDTKRTTQDESLLTTLLASLIRHSIFCTANFLASQEEIDKIHWKEEQINADRLIGQVFPLLGLTYLEVDDLMREEVKKWHTPSTGRK